MWVFELYALKNALNFRSCTIEFLLQTVITFAVEWIALFAIFFFFDFNFIPFHFSFLLKHSLRSEITTRTAARRFICEILEYTGIDAIFRRTAGYNDDKYAVNYSFIILAAEFFALRWTIEGAAQNENQTDRLPHFARPTR